MKEQERQRHIKIAQQLSDPFPLPSCFGILYYADKVCKKCIAQSECQFFTEKWPLVPGHDGREYVAEVAESDIDPMQRILPFKDGSRAYVLLARWGSQWLTRREIEKLSRILFDKTIIDIDRILKILVEKKLLLQASKTFGINWEKLEQLRNASLKGN